MGILWRNQRRLYRCARVSFPGQKTKNATGRERYTESSHFWELRCAEWLKPLCEGQVYHCPRFRQSDMDQLSFLE